MANVPLFYSAFSEVVIAIPLACYRIGFGPPAQNRRKIGKWPQNPIFQPISLFLRLFFRFSGERPWEAETNVFFPYFFCSRPTAFSEVISNDPNILNNLLSLKSPRKILGLSAPKSQRFLRFAIAMPIADTRNRAISETKESNAAL